MENINPEQRKAITHGDGPMLVLAGPGSGKTFVITRRIRNLIEEKKVSPDKILVITFTKNSAEEMKARFDSLMGASMPVSFGTFHAIFFYMLRSCYGYDAGSIVREKEKKQYLKRIIDGFGIDEEIYTYESQILSDISRIKNFGSNPYEAGVKYVSDEIFGRIYEEYASALKENHKLDFDDMVLECRNMLLNNHAELVRWRENYKYILIDEFQDINPMQYEVVRLLARPSNNLFIVGDDDQSIYGFRGSKPEIMLGFKEDYKDAQTVCLSTNYRSHMDIVDSASLLIGNNTNRYKKRLKAASEKKGIVRLYGFDNSQQECEHIIRLINTQKRRGDYSDVAIIYRTNGSARFLTKALTDSKIPYSFKEKPLSFFDSEVARDILAILAFASGDHSRRHFLRFMNKPVRYISRSSLSEQVNLKSMMFSPGIKQYLQRNIETLINQLEYVSKLDMYGAVNYIRKGMGYEEFIVKEALDNGRDISDIKEILDLIEDSARGKETYKQFLEYIEEYNLELARSAISDDDTDRVHIMTMHGSKGLEFKMVILPGLSEGTVPQSKATTPASIEEERRVFYVALTRAKESLYLTYVKKSRTHKQERSRFLAEIKGLEEY